MKALTKSSPHHLIHPQRFLRSVALSCCAVATSIILLSAPPNAAAQSDNFDSGTLSPSWTVYDANPALVSLTFPANGNGKALRIQANPYPPASLPAVVGLAQTNVYTDFYMAVDMVNWVVEDQAVVLIGRFTPGGSFGLDGGQGVICNYDAWQAGDAIENPPAGGRHGGEFQMNS